MLCLHSLPPAVLCWQLLPSVSQLAHALPVKLLMKAATAATECYLSAPSAPEPEPGMQVAFPMLLDCYEYCTEEYRKELDGPRAAAAAIDSKRIEASRASKAQVCSTRMADVYTGNWLLCSVLSDLPLAAACYDTADWQSWRQGQPHHKYPHTLILHAACTMPIKSCSLACSSAVAASCHLATLSLPVE